MKGMTSSAAPAATNSHPAIRIELRAIEEGGVQLPRRRRAPLFLPMTAPLPRIGEVIYLTSTSAWGVRLVVHEWLAPDDLHVIVWVEHVGATHHAGRAGFAVTQ